MKINKYQIICLIAIIISFIIYFGSFYYWQETDKVSNVNGNYLPFVNLSRAESNYRYNVGQVSMISGFTSFSLLFIVSVPNMFKEQEG